MRAFALASNFNSKATGNSFARYGERCHVCVGSVGETELFAAFLHFWVEKSFSHVISAQRKLEMPIRIRRTSEVHCELKSCMVSYRVHSTRCAPLVLHHARRCGTRVPVVTFSYITRHKNAFFIQLIATFSAHLTQYADNCFKNCQRIPKRTKKKEQTIIF